MQAQHNSVRCFLPPSIAVAHVQLCHMLCAASQPVSIAFTWHMVLSTLGFSGASMLPLLSL
jgi:hypothetical protein